MSKTIVPSDASQEKRMHKAPKNIEFVGSRKGAAFEAKMTQKSSMKHANPEYFKRQSDRKNDQTGFQMKQFYRGTTY